ncbi:LysE family translocator [Actinomadura sp. NAK00032]|uniref:LysE family translocator n=1 Tax=Actinomadura sp. NAK00032 TaxID=2742128 RepID=UPI001C377DDC|nr:LysE family transporter [Actinomadura sp. NAK00032]
MHWHAFLTAAAVMAITPGANQLLSLRNAAQQGARDAVAGLAGRLTAFFTLVLATAAGLSALLLASEPAFAAVKWCGVAYLLYLGARMLIKHRPAETEPGRRGRWELIRQEF